MPSPLAEILKLCGNAAFGKGPENSQNPKDGQNSTDSEAPDDSMGNQFSKRVTDNYFYMNRQAVRANFYNDERVVTSGLCGCWVVAIISRDGVLASHILPGLGGLDSNGNWVLTRTDTQMASSQIGQLQADYRAQPMYAASGLIVAHAGATPEATGILRAGLEQLGLEVQMAEYGKDDIRPHASVPPNRYLWIQRGNDMAQVLLDGQQLIDGEFVTPNNGGS